MRQPPLLLSIVLLAIVLTSPATAGPSVVPTAEGQIGETPADDDRVQAGRFESIRGQAGDILLGGLFVFGGAAPPPPEMQFLTDALHGTPNPVPVDAIPSPFVNVDFSMPGSDRRRNAADDGDFVAFAFAVDGTAPQTTTIRISTFDETGEPIYQMPVVVDAPTFPDPSVNSVGVGVDNQGRATVAYTELSTASPALVMAQRFDVNGVPIGGGITISDDGHAATDVALLDPSGQRLLVPSSDFATIQGNILDLSDPTPVVLAEFPISTTPAIFANLGTKVASDPASGLAIVAWENISAEPGDPINVFARRFDAAGNPIGNDFRVNTTTANAQAQPAVAVGPNGITAVAWAGDASVQPDVLDVFLQVYDQDGNPIGGEIPVNTYTTDVQDKPAVRFLPEPDAQGRPQVAVVWRDVANIDGSGPRGTGRSYRCFSIDGLGPPDVPIFADGFESGDTTSWSDTRP